MLERSRGENALDRTARAPRVTGLVLCGGQSARMGRDKARIVLGDATLLERAVTLLRATTAEVLLAPGATSRYADLGVVECLDRFPGAGPLAGIEAGLARARDGLVIVLAVDLPSIDRALLDALVLRAIDEDLDVVLPRSSRGLEPLCAVWNARMARAARRALEAGRSKVVACFDEVLDAGRRPRIGVLDVAHAFADPRARAIEHNLNTPEELARARALLGVSPEVA